MNENILQKFADIYVYKSIHIYTYINLFVYVGSKFSLSISDYVLDAIM